MKALADGFGDEKMAFNMPKQSVLYRTSGMQLAELEQWAAENWPDSP
jgi:hypothetical protein